MDLTTLSLITTAHQFAQAANAFLGKISPPPSNVWAAAALVVGKQLTANAVTVLGQGVASAQAEFQLGNKDDKAIGQALNSLPPIS